MELQYLPSTADREFMSLCDDGWCLRTSLVPFSHRLAIHFVSSKTLSLCEPQNQNPIQKYWPQDDGTGSVKMLLILSFGLKKCACTKIPAALYCVTHSQRHLKSESPLLTAIMEATTVVSTNITLGIMRDGVGQQRSSRETPVGSISCIPFTDMSPNVEISVCRYLTPGCWLHMVKALMLITSCS